MPPAICKSTFANPPDLCKVQFAVICDYLQIDKVSRPVTARLRYGMKRKFFVVFVCIAKFVVTKLKLHRQPRFGTIVEFYIIR